MHDLSQQRQACPECETRSRPCLTDSHIRPAPPTHRQAHVKHQRSPSHTRCLRPDLAPASPPRQPHKSITKGISAEAFGDHTCGSHNACNTPHEKPTDVLHLRRQARFCMAIQSTTLCSCLPYWYADGFQNASGLGNLPLTSVTGALRNCAGRERIAMRRGWHTSHASTRDGACIAHSLCAVTVYCE